MTNNGIEKKFFDFLNRLWNAAPFGYSQTLDTRIPQFPDQRIPEELQ